MAKIKTFTMDTKKQGLIGIIRHNSSHPNTSWQKFTNKSIIALLAMKNDKKYGYSSLVWSLNTKESNRLINLNKSEFETDLTKYFGNYLGKLSLTSKRYSWPLKRIDVPQPFSWRCIVIGDAAHTIYPLAGQGFNMAVLDVRELVNSLIWAKNLGLDYGSLEVSNQYFINRRASIKSITKITDGLDWVFNTAPSSLSKGASAGMDLISKSIFLKRKIVDFMNNN